MCVCVCVCACVRACVRACGTSYSAFTHRYGLHHGHWTTHCVVEWSALVATSTGRLLESPWTVKQNQTDSIKGLTAIRSW